MTRAVRIRYRRPPDREDIFVQKILLDAADVKVTLSEHVDFAPIRVHGRTICEPGADIVWFTFPGAWYDVGRFHLADGTFTGYYTNVLTPPRFDAEGGWTTTDLFLDVWMDAAGNVALLDEEQLREAVSKGLVDHAIAESARAEAARIEALGRSGRWPPPIVQEWTLSRVRTQLAQGEQRGTR